MGDLIAQEKIENKILLVRGKRVMLDRDLAELYKVETRSLVQAVKRNVDRFPEDFLFQLSADEFSNLKSQFVTSSWGGTRKLPYAFTENGVAMLSSVKIWEWVIAGQTDTLITTPASASSGWIPSRLIGCLKLLPKANC